MGKKFPSYKDKRNKYLLKYSDTSSCDDLYLLDKYLDEIDYDKEKALDESKEYILNILENRRKKVLKIVMFEFPDPQVRHRSLKTHMHVINAAERKKYFKENVEAILKEINYKIITTPIKLVIDFYLEMPTNIPVKEVFAYQTKVLELTVKPDHDNLDKNYTDMMNLILYLDDDLIHKAIISKYYNLLPRVEISLIYSTKHESKSSYKRIKNRKKYKELEKLGLVEIELLEGV